MYPLDDGEYSESVYDDTWEALESCVRPGRLCTVSTLSFVEMCFANMPITLIRKSNKTSCSHFAESYSFAAFALATFWLFLLPVIFSCIDMQNYARLRIFFRDCLVLLLRLAGALFL